MYSVKFSDGSYTYYRVISIQGDTVVMEENKYGVQKPLELYSIRAKWDGADTIPVLKKDLQSGLDDGDIYSVKRE
ncbi:MAG: hypothetical protein ACKOXB_04475 [Flavobacteriales bacterium]